MVNTVIEAYDRLDCAFNNAGVGGGGLIHEFSEEEWDRIIDINLKGVWLCMKYEISQMLKQRSGAIVNTSSAVGLMGAADMSAYVASQVRHHRIDEVCRVGSQQSGRPRQRHMPRVIRTPLIQAVLDEPAYKEWILGLEPIGREGEPSEIAQAVLWLCSDAASFVTGHAMSVDGGMVSGITPPWI